MFQLSGFYYIPRVQMCHRLSIVAAGMYVGFAWGFQIAAMSRRLLLGFVQICRDSYSLSLILLFKAYDMGFRFRSVCSSVV